MRGEWLVVARWRYCACGNMEAPYARPMVQHVDKRMAVPIGSAAAALLLAGSSRWVFLFKSSNKVWLCSLRVVLCAVNTCVLREAPLQVFAFLCLHACVLLSFLCGAEAAVAWRSTGLCIQAVVVGDAVGVVFELSSAGHVFVLALFPDWNQCVL